MDNAELRALAEGARASASAMAVAGPEQAPSRSGFLRKHRDAMLGGLAAVLAVVALLNIVGTPSASVQYMDSAELEAISEHLGSGYRNQAGTLFVGTLKESWQQLAEPTDSRSRRKWSRP